MALNEISLAWLVPLGRTQPARELDTNFNFNGLDLLQNCQFQQILTYPRSRTLVFKSNHATAHILDGLKGRAV